MKHILPLSVAAFVAMNGSAAAVPVGFGFNAGPITAIDPNAPPQLQAFQLGEDLFVRFVIDSEAPDSSASPIASYDDPTGTISVMGLTSGATLSMSPGAGVEVELDDRNEFELESLVSSASPTIPFILDRDVDFDNNTGDVVNGPFLTDDVDDLAGSIESLSSFVIGGLFRTPNGTSLDASIGYWDFANGRSVARGLDFGPVPTGDVPVPSALPLLATGLAGLVALRRRGR